MSRFRAKRLLFGCSAGNAVLLAEPDSTSASAPVLASLAVDASSVADIAALCSALQALQPATLGPAAGTRSLAVTIDDSLARSFVVTPPRGVQGLRELRAIAAARFATLYGESAEQWLLVGDWHPAAAFVACALPRQLLQALDQCARGNSWRVDTIAPAFVRVANRLHASIPADGWLLVGFGQTLTLLATCHDQVAGARSVQLSGLPDAAALEALLAQERLRSAADSGSGLRQSLLWAGAADWLPAATRVAGLESRTIALSEETLPGVGPSLAAQLALAGRRQ